MWQLAAGAESFHTLQQPSRSAEPDVRCIDRNAHVVASLRRRMQSGGKRTQQRMRRRSRRPRRWRRWEPPPRP